MRSLLLLLSLLICSNAWAGEQVTGKLAVFGNVGIGSNSSSPYVTTNGAAGNLVVQNNVGIGTFSPASALAVVGNSSFTGNVGISGNVGIGTTVAPNKLYVGGTGEFQGFKMTGNGVASGYRLTSNSVGVGTWMPDAPSPTLPIGYNLISITTLSGATSTGSIPIVSGNIYYVIFDLFNFSGSDTLNLSFNADTSGTHYKYINTGSTTTAAITNLSASASQIFIGKQAASAATKGIKGNFYIQQIGASSQIYRIWGQTVFDDQTSNLNALMDFMGTWSNSANAVSFELFSNGGATMSGTVYLYKLNIS